MKRPPFVMLRLTNPRQGTDEFPAGRETIKWLQRVINDSGKFVKPPLSEDGIFGDWTAQETEELCYRLGRKVSIPAIGPNDLVILWRWSNGENLPDDWRARRIARMATGFKKGWGITMRSWMGLHPGQYPPPGSTDFDPSDAADVMESWVQKGWKESPHGSNRVLPMIELAQSLNVYRTHAAMGYAWCQFAAYLAALVAGGESAKLGLVETKFWPLYTPYTLRFGQRGEFGHTLIPKSQARRGDMAMFNFGSSAIVQHVGRLVRSPGSTVVTVDGNTSVTSQDNGGAMMIRERSASTVVGYVRDS